jgi:hypothetical protein
MARCPASRTSPALNPSQPNLPRRDERPCVQCKVARVMGLNMALCGLSLMSIGLAISLQLQLEGSANPTEVQLAEVVSFATSVVGALLTFLGAIRIGLTARPGHSLSSGLALVAGISLLTMMAVRLSTNSSWDATKTLGLSLIILRIDGLVLVSTALWRLLIKQGRT